MQRAVSQLPDVVTAGLCPRGGICYPSCMATTRLKRDDQRTVHGPVLAVVMDGIGIGDGTEGDAVTRAATPNLDRYASAPLSTALAAHGRAVGMPSDDDMGNSEVGHNAIGAGRIFAQGAKRVADAVADGSIFRGEAWGKVVARCTSGSGTLHLLGLLSDGNVHSHINHVVALLNAADAAGIATVRLHVLLDGRDVPGTSALTYVERVEAALSAISIKNLRDYRIASGGGRMLTTLDRYESDWSIVERGWRAHVLGDAEHFGSITEAVRTFRERTPGIIDQDLSAFVIADGNGPIGAIEDGSAVVAFNFRGDRMLQISRAFENEDFSGFDRVRRPDTLYVGMTCYDGDTACPKTFLVEPPAIEGTLSERLCHAGLRQFACSETQKFGHVTYFWNGNRSEMFDRELENYVEIPSLAPPFDAAPAMRCPEIIDATAQAIVDGTFDFGRINLPNGDMVGHTGNLDATVQAVAEVDRGLAVLERALAGVGGTMVITADHGNADDMFERHKKTGAVTRTASGIAVPKTSHSLAAVPFHVVGAGARGLTPADVTHPGLGHLAGTFARLLGFHVPEDFLPSLVD